MEAKVYQFMADGFEDVEALIPVDVLRRGGVDIKTVSIMGRLEVESAHGVTIKADMLFEDADLSDADLLMLPGGMPGASNLDAHEGLKAALLKQAEAGKKISAICAAPFVLGKLGILKGKRATCYPGFEQFLEGATYTASLFTIDGNIITGEGPAAAFPYAYSILALLTTEETATEVATGMRYVDYLSTRVWQPLQMESPAVVNIDSRKHGVAHAFGGISTSMRDLAKIGRLYMNGGVWNGKRIVGEDWIRQTTDYSENNDGYHFNWYNLSNIGADKAQYPGYYAHGIRGQVLYVNPYKHVIMVRMGKQDNTFASIPYVFEQLSNCGF